MDAAAATEPDAEQALQAARDLAVRQAALLIEFDDGGLGVGSQLNGGGAEGVGRLQGMAPLHPTAAMTALADVNVELPVNRLARDLNLELLGDVGEAGGMTWAGEAAGRGEEEQDGPDPVPPDGSVLGRETWGVGTMPSVPRIQDPKSSRLGAPSLTCLRMSEFRDRMISIQAEFVLLELGPGACHRLKGR